MAKVLVIEPGQYINGFVSLRRGDQWQIRAQVVDQKKNYQSPVDLTGYSATAFFPGVDADVTVTPVITDAPQGLVEIVVPASDTPDVEETPNGSTIYLTLQSAASGPETVAPIDSPFQFLDRGFESV